jgi:ectoine hydroxylase-related dioxygenase (phytanoyl-CoA dioxygenase family)
MEKATKLSGDLIENFASDGVVVLRKAFSPDWLQSLAAGIRKDLASPSERLVRHTGEDAGAHYWEDFWVWSEIPEFEDFLRHSPAAAYAGRLLKALRINLVMDNWFYREAGSSGRPPWHHDISYFDFTGSMCVLWLPLQAASRREGIAFLRGSHLWGRHFLRTRFAGHRVDGAPGWVNGVLYEEPPNIDDAPEDYDIVRFDLEAGDCIFFDMRTLHGALESVVTKTDSLRFTARFTAEDGRIQYRGDWAREERTILEAWGHREGDALDSAFFPRLWEKETEPMTT